MNRQPRMLVLQNFDIFSELQSIHIGGLPEGRRELLGFSERVPYDYRSGRQPRLRLGLPEGDEETVLPVAGFQIATAMSHIILLNIYCDRGWIGRSKASQWQAIFSSLKQLTTLQYHHIPSRIGSTDSSLQLMKDAVVVLLDAITCESSATTPPVLPALESFWIIDVEPSVVKDIESNILQCIETRRATAGLPDAFDVMLRTFLRVEAHTKAG